MTAHLLDTNGKKNGVTGVVDTGPVVRVIIIKTWEGKNGLHEGRSNSNEPQIGSRQPRSNVPCRKKTNKGPSHGRTGFLDELPGGRELRRFRPINLGL